MLTSLRIRNLAVVEDVAVEFAPGLNVLTGETGAGKSILVDALGLVAGARADSAMVRAGEARGSVEAVFDVTGDPAIPERLEARGIACDDGVLVARRQLSAGGAGRAFLNDSPCTVTLLREVVGGTLDIVGQHESASLTGPAVQRAHLDRFGAHGDLADDVAARHARVVDRREEARALEERGRARLVRMEELRARIEEIDEVAPRPGERGELELERTRARHGATIAEAVDEAKAELGGDGGALGRIHAARRAIGRVADVDPSLAGLAERSSSAALELEDVLGELDACATGADVDPGRIEAIESRLAALERLFLRFGADEEEVLAAREAASAELVGLEDLDAERDRVASAVLAAETEYAEAARRLSARRRAAAKKLGPAIADALVDLALPKARFEVAVEPLDGETVTHADGSEEPLGPHGGDRVEFRISMNPGEVARPLGRVASGGERSRILLALHGVLDSGADARTSVFDEVDSGVGGAVADAIGRRLAAAARGRQVLCVTHLPQVAAYGDAHVSVRKSIDGARTRTEVHTLAPGERVQELARMLGGRGATDASERNAAEMIAQASTGRASTVSEPRSSRRAKGGGARERSAGTRRRPDAGAARGEAT